MARMHSRRRGKSRSKKPLTSASWVSYSADEVVELVMQLFKEGKPQSQIGLILRDAYGIPSVKDAAGASISQILKKEKALPEYPEDLMNLFRKAVRLHKHISANKGDVINTRSLHLAESKIRRLAAYYKKSGVLPRDWNYSPQQIALIIKSK